jgi:uncharacterized protein (DUF1015 family)
VASLPYDVVSTTEARAIAEGNPDSFLHVVRSEIDLPESTDPHDAAVYERARVNLQRMLDDGVLMHDRSPQMYWYRQVLDHRSQVGLVCCCHVDDYESDVIRKHEKTRPDKEDDRTQHLLTVNAHTGPVFLTYRDDERVEKIMSDDLNERPLYHFNAPDGVTHSAWFAKHPVELAACFETMPAVYVADGHHRTASAARAAAERRAANPNHTGDEAYNWFLSVLFPASTLSILPYNRVVRDLNGRSAGETLDALAAVGKLTPTDQAEPDRPAAFCVYVDGRWHELQIDPDSIDRNDPIRSLDVDLLQSRVLEPVFGIGDPRTDQRIDFVGGIRGTEELERRVDSGDAAAAFSLSATTIDQLLTVADSGLIMPPKSTWFEPKLRSGLFVHSLE